MSGKDEKLTLIGLDWMPYYSKKGKKGMDCGHSKGGRSSKNG
jgi:hypothetical protein